MTATSEINRDLNRVDQPNLDRVLNELKLDIQNEGISIGEISEADQNLIPLSQYRYNPIGQGPMNTILGIAERYASQIGNGFDPSNYLFMDRKKNYYLVKSSNQQAEI